MKIAITTQLYCNTTSDIELPEGVEWKDIKEWYVKWDNFFFTTQKGVNYEVPLFTTYCGSDIDWKRPSGVEILAYDEDDDFPDYDNVLEDVSGNCGATMQRSNPE